MLLILKFTQYVKSNKVPSLIYTYLESLNKKSNSCKNNPEKSCTTKLGEHIPSGRFLWYGHLMLWKTRMMHDVYRNEDCMYRSCKYFKEHAMKLINLEKKKLIPFTKCRNQMLVQKCHICKTVLWINTLTKKNILK